MAEIEKKPKKVSWLEKLKISLKNNKRNILGRGVVIHKGTDDCGDGNHKDSLKTGNAGDRLACGVIVIRSDEN